MKRTFVAAAVALATLTGAASAMTMSSSQAILEQYAPNIHVAELTEAQVNTLLAIVYSGDSFSEKSDTIRHFVK